MDTVTTSNPISQLLRYSNSRRVTRERPRLIRRFINPHAEFLHALPVQALGQVEK